MYLMSYKAAHLFTTVLPVDTLVCLYLSIPRGSDLLSLLHILFIILIQYLETGVFLSLINAILEVGCMVNARVCMVYI